MSLRYAPGEIILLCPCAAMAILLLCGVMHLAQRTSGKFVSSEGCETSSHDTHQPSDIRVIESWITLQGAVDHVLPFCKGRPALDSPLLLCLASTRGRQIMGLFWASVLMLLPASPAPSRTKFCPRQPYAPVLFLLLYRRNVPRHSNACLV